MRGLLRQDRCLALGRSRVLARLPVLAWALVVGCLASLPLATAVAADGPAPIEVRVGGYSFPPYVDFAADGDPHGFALDLLASLNRQQQRYWFRFVATSPNRRYQDFATGRFDMMLFEHLSWGWANEMMEASRPFLRDSDRFVTAVAAGRDQQYFATLDNKHIFATHGFHYRFVGDDPDPAALASRFRLALLDPKASSLDRGLQQIALGQADLMVVTDSYLQHYFRQRPAMSQQLLLAAEADSEYLHGALLRRQRALTAAEFDGLIAGLRQSGELQRLAEQYGVGSLLLPAP